MKSRRLGRSALVVSELGLGTMTFGSMADEAQSLAIMDRALEAGIDFFDTAEIYPVPPDPKYAGRSEEILGKWLSGRRRDSVFIATKIAGPGGGWFQAPVRGGKVGLDRHSIESAVELSLQRLGTDYIDLYQTHWSDRGLPFEETLEGLARVVDAGKVRVIGCSNESTYGLTKSLWAADVGGYPRFETVQNGFSFLDRRAGEDLREVCRSERISLLPYSPLAAGVLSGKYQGGVRPQGARFSLYETDTPRTQALTRRFLNEKTLAVTARFMQVAKEAGLPPVTLAIAWTLTCEFVGSTLIGATSVDQLTESLAAADLQLADEVRQACDRLAREIPYPIG